MQQWPGVTKGLLFMPTKTKRTNRQWARSPRVLRARMLAVLELRYYGFSIKETGTAIGRTPDQVRRIEAQSRRIIQ